MHDAHLAIETLTEWVRRSQHIVFFCGAGCSTDSGIPDFRSSGGIYDEAYGDLSPERIISHSFFCSDPETFFRFYREKLCYPDAKPCAAHRIPAKWGEEGKDVTVITQNIDGLDVAAGSKHVVELHGSVHRNACMKCGKKYEGLPPGDGVWHCSCGGIVKPDVVLYEEPLAYEKIEQALDALSRAELVIVMGTSLAVYPANQFLHQYTGDRLVILNLSETSMDGRANLRLYKSIGEVLEEVDRRLHV